MTSQLQRYSIADLLGIYDISAHELAKMAKVHTGTVMRAIFGGQFKTNVTSAEAIADALGMNVEEIIWPNGLSNFGRPAHTGSSITKVVQCKQEHILCPVHNVVLPTASSRCDFCA